MHSEADLKEQLVSHSVDTWRMVVAAVTLRLKNDKVTERACKAGLSKRGNHSQSRPYTFARTTATELAGYSIREPQEMCFVDGSRHA